MPRPIVIRVLAATILTVAIGSPAWAEWLVASESSISYVSLKNNAVAENNRLTGLTGGIDADGTLSMTIDLASVETGVDIRNQRMAELFFEVARFPKAHITGKVSDDQLAALSAGEVIDTAIPLTLDLHGVSATLTASLRAYQVADTLYVNSTEPILLQTAQFNLLGGVEALRNIAGLKAIAQVVPVTVDLQLTADTASP